MKTDVSLDLPIYLHMDKEINGRNLPSDRNVCERIVEEDAENTRHCADGI